MTGTASVASELRKVAASRRSAARESLRGTIGPADLPGIAAPHKATAREGSDMCRGEECAHQCAQQPSEVDHSASNSNQLTSESLNEIRELRHVFGSLVCRPRLPKLDVAGSIPVSRSISFHGS
jgi:hypothetical protein